MLLTIFPHQSTDLFDGLADEVQPPRHVHAEAQSPLASVATLPECEVATIQSPFAGPVIHATGLAPIVATKEERAQAHAQAKRLLEARYPSIKFDQVGWSGWVRLEAEILLRAKQASTTGAS